MKKKQAIDCLRIDELSATPKYQQLVNAALNAIKQGILKKGDVMPSINELSFQYEISRVTIEKGYNKLRKMGILEAHHGKGYFISSTETSQDLKIFLMFNKLSAHKKIIYDAFVQTLGDKGAVDFYIYNNDFNLFKKLLQQQKEEYTHYVIIAHFLERDQDYKTIIDLIPKEKLILVDKKVDGISGSFGAVYENFEDNIFNALCQALDVLSKYHTLKLIFPEISYFPKEIENGFKNFCRSYAFNYKIVSDIDLEDMNEGEVYINLMEEDLVKILDKIIALDLIVGEQVGVISYNETPLKKFIMNGLTTISTDFEKMGKTAAKLVLESSNEQIENPFKLILRGSL
ncbi:GntR family transcriptional regulator [Flavobacterium plurextorum]|uniref:winged helix-turn-helix domain-containing protein n=1 Tax=Flavobacterium TaxID=237 RepID=UPI00214D6CC9|nr:MULTISPECIES: GntR family transcriptional regulator [Flavobacterium]UUW08331.1 GntR family transcriptional regulator [Flavobacterium plurextorum]